MNEGKGLGGKIMDDKTSFVFSCVLIKEDEGYSALCLELDVASQGETIEEAKKNIIEAMTLYLETAMESNLPIIRPVPYDDNPYVMQPEKVIETFKVNVDLEINAYV
jgi:predicted RNase H-like HicB family nuclease